jgi:hypothetical protein
MIDTSIVRVHQHGAGRQTVGVAATALRCGLALVSRSAPDALRDLAQKQHFAPRSLTRRNVCGRALGLRVTGALVEAQDAGSRLGRAPRQYLRAWLPPANFGLLRNAAQLVPRPNGQRG